MMVVGYNGILFQDVGSVTQRLGHYQWAPTLGYRLKKSGIQNQGGTKRLINDNHQTFWS